MCMGGSKPKPAPAPAQAAPVTSKAPNMEMDLTKEETAAEGAKRQRKGKKGLRINRSGSSANVNSTGSGLNIPKG